MTTTNSTILKVVHVMFWIAFIGLCIKTGAILTSFFVSLFVNDIAAGNLYLGLDLTEVFTFSKTYYIYIVSLLVTLTGLKAYIGYLIIKFFLKFNLEKPFDAALTPIFMKISHVALTTGLLALVANGYSKWLIKKGTSIPVDWSGNEILFFAGVIYLLALVFKRGTELQTENDLTV